MSSEVRMVIMWPDCLHLNLQGRIRTEKYNREKKYCIYHIWVFISSCFNNHFINNFPFRLVQKFWEMEISCSYAYIPSPYLHLTSHMLPAKVMLTCVGNRFLIIYFWPHCLFPEKCLNYLIIDQKYSVVYPYHATFNLTFLNKKNT